VRSPPTGSATPPKLRSQRYYLISWWHLTKATWRNWPFWTCPPRPTQSITVFCLAASASNTASVAWRRVGSVLAPLLLLLISRRWSPPSSSVRGRHAGVQMVSTDSCQSASSQDVAEHRWRLKLEPQQQAAAERYEDRLCLVLPISSTPLHQFPPRTY